MSDLTERQMILDRIISLSTQARDAKRAAENNAITVAMGSQWGTDSMRDCANGASRLADTAKIAATSARESYRRLNKMVTSTPAECAIRCAANEWTREATLAAKRAKALADRAQHTTAAAEQVETQNSQPAVA